MNKSRFYEILLAHKKGEDLSVFVPTNAPEARLLADLQGGGGSVSVVGEGEKEQIAVPNSGTVNKVYFNTNLSIGEVEDFFSISPAKLDNLYWPYGEDELCAYYYFLASNNNCVVMKYENDDRIIVNEKDGTAYFVAYDNDSEYGFTGWNPDIDFSQGITIDEEVTDQPWSTNWNIGGSIGEDNDKLLSLFYTYSVTPGETIQLSGNYDGSTLEVSTNETIDVEALLKEGKLPLKIKVNVE